MTFWRRLTRIRKVVVVLIVALATLAVYLVVPMHPVQLQLEYSSLPSSDTWSVHILVDGATVAELSLTPTNVAPLVEDLGEIRVRGGSLLIAVLLNGEPLLEERIFRLGQGHLWIVVGADGGHVGLGYRPPLWA